MKTLLSLLSLSGLTTSVSTVHYLMIPDGNASVIMVSCILTGLLCLASMVRLAF